MTITASPPHARRGQRRMRLACRELMETMVTVGAVIHAPLYGQIAAKATPIVTTVA